MTVRREKSWRVGAMLWALGVLFLPLQLVVAMQWPTGYSLTGSAISDLGVTSCDTFADGSAPVRVVCSPWHAVFSVGLVALGVLTTLGAISLYGRWNDRSGKAGVTFAGVSGIFVVLVGLAPWDVAPDVHDLAALCQALLQWAAMTTLAVAAGSGRFRILTFACVVVSMAGFAAFLMALDGAELPLLPLGIAERVAFDSLTLWTAVVGLTVLVDVGSRSRSQPAGDTAPPR